MVFNLKDSHGVFLGFPASVSGVLITCFQGPHVLFLRVLTTYFRGPHNTSGGPLKEFLESP